jgi:hypothetical protein
VLPKLALGTGPMVSMFKVSRFHRRCGVWFRVVLQMGHSLINFFACSRTFDPRSVPKVFQFFFKVFSKPLCPGCTVVYRAEKFIQFLWAGSLFNKR